jgi:DNA-3-methyladenine glycosylase II
MDSDLTRTYQQAADHLSSHDPRLAPVIARFGLCTIQPHTNYYQDLVESIIGQQLSVKAAATIRDRFKALFNDTLPSPEAIIATDVQTMRSAGLSNQKANYIRDLAQHVIDGRISFDNIDALSNEEIIAKLTDVKGIGEWTVHMFLMFCMGRLDILAHGDLGIRSGIKKLYDLEQLPNPQEVRTIADDNHWQPYASIACWYIWQSLDNKPVNS